MINFDIREEVENLTLEEVEKAINNLELLLKDALEISTDSLIINTIKALNALNTRAFALKHQPHPKR